MNARVIERRRAANEAETEARDFLHGVRRELDELWRVARNPIGTREVNREIADNAAHELLQCLSLAEDFFDRALRIAARLPRSQLLEERLERYAVSLDAFGHPGLARELRAIVRTSTEPDDEDEPLDPSDPQRCNLPKGPESEVLR